MSLATINTELSEITGANVSLAKNLENLISDISATYTAVETKGGTVPANKNAKNLATTIGGLYE